MRPCILVFGMPRSGTTWVGKLFDSHPDTLYRHEPDSVHKLPLPAFPELADAPRYRGELEHFVASLPRMRSPEIVGKQPLFRKHYQSVAGLHAYRASVLLAKTASRVQRHFPCIVRPTASNGRRARVVWKSIESPGRLGVCMLALPEARAIHLMRHPCGYIASVLRGEAAGHFADRSSSAADPWVLRRLLATEAGKHCPLDPDTVAKLAPEERLAWTWVLTQEAILADVDTCRRVLSVRYEDVCVDPVALTRRMFDFAGLDWQAQTEIFIQASTQGHKSGYYDVHKNPRISALRWRTELPEETIERIFAILRTSDLSHFYPNVSLTTTARTAS